MKAMILAAGLGTRLRPLTGTRPKALVGIRGRPLLAWVLARLRQHGFTDVVVNAYHRAEQIAAFARAHQDEYRHSGVSLTVLREPDLLGTGGGLCNAAPFFDDGRPFLLHNVDVLTDLDLRRLMEAHRASGALATLAVRARETDRYLLFDERNRLCGRQCLRPPETRMIVRATGRTTPLSFMGVHVISPAIFDRLNMPPPFSIIDAYLEEAAVGERIMAFRAEEARWMDVGRRADLERAPAYFGPAFFEGPEEGARQENPRKGRRPCV